MEITFEQEREKLKAIEHFPVQLPCLVTEKLGPGVAVIVIHGDCSQLTWHQMGISEGEVL